MKRAVRDAGLTLDELARLIGCSRALIYQYASGASLAQSDRLQQIATAVGKPLPWFFQEDSSDAEPQASADPSTAGPDAEALLAEKERLTAERARIEQRRAADDIARLETLLAAYSSPPDPRKVVDCCHQLYPLLARIEEPQKLAAMLLQQGNALVQLQEWGAAREKLEEAGALYRAAGNSISTRDCLQSLGHVNLMLGRVEEALTQFEHVASGEDWANRWQGTLSVGACREVLGDYSDAITAFERALEIVEEKGEAPGTDVARLNVEANWSNLELNFGDFASALQRSERCIRSALRLGVQDQYIEAFLTCGAAQLQLDDLSAAGLSFQQALDVAELTGDQQHRSLALSYQSLCDTAGHRTKPAISAGKEALAIALRCSAVRAEVAAQRALSEAYLAASNAPEALYHAQQGLLVAANMRLRLSQAQFGVLKARAFLLEERFEESAGEAAKALALAEDLHARPVQIECHLAGAQSALAQGKTEAVVRHANAVIELAGLLKLSHWSWKGYAALALARLRQGERENAIAEFQRALEGLTLVRRRHVEATGEDTVLEEPLAQELWQNWLRVLVETEGLERARAAVIEAEWPPLVEWTEQQLEKDGGTPDA